MPNKPHRDKQKDRPKSKPVHVADLMQRMLSGRVTQSGNSVPLVSRNAAPAPAASVSDEWRELLRKALDPELGPHIENVLVKPKELVVFTDSAAWCTRLKLAQGQISEVVKTRDAGIMKIQIRIMPAGGR